MATRGLNDDYAELKGLVKQNGLFEPQPTYYAWKFLSTAMLLAASVALLLVLRSFALQLLDAVFLALAFTQLALLGHDIGHRQVFRKPRWIQLSTFALNVLVGLSLSWWTDRHNRHHAHPNQFDLDPDVETPFFSFRRDDVGRSQTLQIVMRYQVYLFFASLLLLALVFRIWSVHFLLQRKAKHPLLEGTLILLHFVLYFGLLLSCLSLSQALVFTAVNQLAFGLFIGSTVAPNHKGMPTLDKDTSLSFLQQQVLTARNVRAHPITDFWYGGLNYQIEHHLFPSVPRNRLGDLQRIVRAFCASHSVAYCETGVLQSFREIIQGLREASSALRAEKPLTSSS